MNQTIVGLIKKEFIQSLRDPRMRLLIFIAPLIQLTIFGFAITNEVKNIRLGFHFSKNDFYAKEIYQQAVNSNWFKKTETIASNPFNAIQSNRVDAVIVSPPNGLTSSIVRNQGELQLLINSTNILRAQAIERYIKIITNNVIKKQHLDRAIISSATPQIKFDIRLLYNPQMESAVFMVPGVICMISSLISIILTSMSLSKEREQGTLEMLISTPIKNYELILGKTIPFFILGIANVPLILLFGIVVFNVPVRGSIMALALASIAFITTCVAIGILISSIAKNQQQGMLGAFIFQFPAIMLSGIMFPIENMPIPLKILAYLNPLTYYAALLRNILLKAGNMQLISSYIAILLLIACIAILLSIRSFKKSIV